MKSFRDYGGVSKRTHLGWAAGDVHHTDLNEDLRLERGYHPHLQNLQPTPTDALQDHQVHPDELKRFQEHHSQMRMDSRHRSDWDGVGSISVTKLEPYTAMRHYKENSGVLFNEPLRNAHHNEDSGSIELNTQRYGGNDFFRHTHDEVHHAVKQLEHATNFTTSHPMTLYRGIYRSSGIHTMAPGTTFVDHGFTGTSLRKHVADEFGDVHTDWVSEHEGVPRDLVGKTPIARIHAPAGTKGHFLDVEGHAFSPHGSEKEFLLHRGTHFQVIGHTKSAMHHMVHIRVIGNEPKPIFYGGHFKGLNLREPD